MHDRIIVPSDYWMVRRDIKNNQTWVRARTYEESIVVPDGFHLELIDQKGDRHFTLSRINITGEDNG